MLKSRNILLKTAKRIFVILVLFTITKFVFAVSGIRSGGGDNKHKNASQSNAFSNIKSTVTFSLKSKLQFNSDVLNPNTEEHFVMYNSILTYRKGNVTYILPYKTRSIKLPSFIRLCPMPAGK